jgi:hypothetical protein
MSEEQLAAAYTQAELRELCSQLRVPSRGSSKAVMAFRVALAYSLRRAADAGTLDPASMSEEQLAIAYSSMDLKEMCYKLGLPTPGSKAARAQRIAEAHRFRASANEGSTADAGAADPATMSQEQLMAAYTADELHQLCVQLGVASSGGKAVLAQQLARAYRAGTADPASMSEEQLVAAYTHIELKELCWQHRVSNQGSKADTAQRLVQAYRLGKPAVRNRSAEAGAADPASMSEEQLVAAYTQAELRELCWQRWVSIRGSKADMAQRLAQAYRSGEAANGSRRAEGGADPASMSEEQLVAAYTLHELGKLCSQLGVPSTGKKAAVAQRLVQAYGRGQAADSGRSADVNVADPASMSEEQLIAAYTTRELRELCSQLGVGAPASKAAVAQCLARAYKARPPAAAAASRILAAVADGEDQQEVLDDTDFT